MPLFKSLCTHRKFHTSCETTSLTIRRNIHSRKIISLRSYYAISLLFDTFLLCERKYSVYLVHVFKNRSPLQLHEACLLYFTRVRNNPSAKPIRNNDKD
jgi:hypothetical protein